MATTAAILPAELIAEIISLLPVKSLMKFICVNKFFKTLISDYYFVQLHLKKSSPNSHLALMWRHNLEDEDSSLVTLSIPRLLQKKPFTIFNDDPYYRLKENLVRQRVVGSCNGLLCLIYIPHPYLGEHICFWNPATRTKSENFRIFSGSFHCWSHHFSCSFGYDNSSGTYKVVAFYMEVERGFNPKSVVKVFSLGDNSWKDIQCFPVLPLYWFYPEKCNGVYLSGTTNWLALHNYFRQHYDFDGISVEQYVIVSLNLSTELYTEMLLPRGFDEVPHVQPTVVVLRNCLCFCHHFKRSYFVIWQMKDFGVQESWIQLFKISYQNFCSGSCDYLFYQQWLKLLPVYLAENEYILISAENATNQTFIYNCRDNKVERIKVTNKIHWLQAKEYAGSLVPTR